MTGVKTTFRGGGEDRPENYTHVYPRVSSTPGQPASVQYVSSNDKPKG